MRKVHIIAFGLLTCIMALVNLPKAYAGTGIHFHKPALLDVYGDTVYFMSDASHMNELHFYAVDAKTGEQRWEISGYEGWAAPALVDGEAYFGDLHQGKLYARDIASGRETWTLEVGRLAYKSHTAIGGVLYVRAPKSIYAVDIKARRVKWSVPVEDVRDFHPVISSGVLYFGNLDTLYAVSAETGQHKWKKGIAKEAWSWPTPLVTNDIVYAGAGEKFYALDAQTGTERWAFSVGTDRANTDRSVGTGFSAMAGDAVLLVDDEGVLHALDAKTGKRRWKAKTNGTDGQWPKISHGVVCFVDQDGSLRTLDVKTGRNKWSAKGQFDRLSMSEGVIYAASKDCRLSAMDVNAGHVIWEWSFKPRGPASRPTSPVPSARLDNGYRACTPVAYGGMVYFGNWDAIYGIDSKTGTEMWKVTL